MFPSSTDGAASPFRPASDHVGSMNDINAAVKLKAVVERALEADRALCENDVDAWAVLQCLDRLVRDHCCESIAAVRTRML